MKHARPFPLLALSVLMAAWMPARGEVILQYFETRWDEMYLRLPELAEIGYDALWHPSPTKSPIAGVFPNGGGGNVGYSLFDRFDLGDTPQRGAMETRYGSRGSLRGMVDNAHRSGMKIYPDIVFNHTGNGPHIESYPGMRKNDFHGWNDAGQPLGFKRSPRMSGYDDISNGYGLTFQEELVSLFDIQLERDNRFSVGPPFFVTPGVYVRQPGQYDKYPFHNPGDALPAEHPVDFMERWINWLGYAMDYDGVRLDAPKHVIREFFGTPGSGFNHQIQWNFDNRRGFSDPDSIDQMYQQDIHRDDALIFAEMFIGSVGEVGYWRDHGVKMRYLDFPRLKQMMYAAFNGGNMAVLNSFAGFDPSEGVTFAHSHDEDFMGKKELAYAYILTHIGVPVVYFTGNNYDNADKGTRNWLYMGYESALGDWGNNTLPNLVYIHNQFARGREWTRSDPGDGQVFAYERYDDLNANATPDAGEGLLLVALNGSGGDQTRTFSVTFPDGTVLKDYTGRQPDITVHGGQATLTVFGWGGQGFACYAPYNAEASGDPIRFGGAVPMPWVVPGGRLAPAKPRTLTRLTHDTVTIDIHFTAPTEGVNSVMVKWGNGQRVNDTAYFETGNGIVSGGFQQASFVAPGHWRFEADLSGQDEGLHLVQARVFNARPAGRPALFQTFREVVYLDRQAPALVLSNLAENDVLPGDRVVEVLNPDHHAARVEWRVDGGAWQDAHFIQRGQWKFVLRGLANGAHSLELRATEMDEGQPRGVLRTGTFSRAFSVDNPGLGLTLNHAEGATLNLPFYTSSGQAGPGNVRLFWNGFEMANVLQDGGNWTHTFTGHWLSGGETLHLTGAFVNGPNFFEARYVQGGQTQTVARTVHFNLYGVKDHPTLWRYAYDSDGDGIPDEIEMPGFTSGDAPGPNVRWPGDDNWDMIPNNGEHWTRLNPMNHDTTYNGVWDGDEDWDGDGFSNRCEVEMGFLLHGNPAYYNIYDAASKPDTCAAGPVGARIDWSPKPPAACDGNAVTLTYTPNEGPLMGLSPVSLGWLANGVFAGIVEMSPQGGVWQGNVPLSGDIGAIAFWFQAPDGAGTAYDNNLGANHDLPVMLCATGGVGFVLDGLPDSPHYEIVDHGMKIWAAARGDMLYAATWSAHNPNSAGNDHFLFITDEFGDRQAAPWAKAGGIYANLNAKPWAAGESGPFPNAFHTLNHGGSQGRVAMGEPGQVLECEINLVEVFGYRPERVWLAAVAWGDNDGDGIASQAPAAWDADNVIQIMEFQAVNIASITDADGDGHFDRGRPVMESVVGGNTQDANYNLRRFLIDERLHESASITLKLFPNVAPGDTVGDVQLITNLNRRDFAVLEEDLDRLDPADTSTYFRAYPMVDAGGGEYTLTLPVNRCGAYRVNARYRVNGGPWIYYTDHAQRRDLAVVVSPRSVLDTLLYEVNPGVVEATDDTFAGRSTFRDLATANTDRPDVVNVAHFQELGVNMLWLQPIHPIGIDGRDTDPETNAPWDPGSPYAVRDYWSVNPILGAENTAASALAEFQAAVAALDAGGIGVMMDGTFNHSAPDAILGQGAADLFPWATDPATEIRHARPQWFARAGSPGQSASYYNNSLDNDIAVAPDRIDFGKWSDVREFYFGRYDALVKGGNPGQTDSRHFHEYMLELDEFEGHDAFTREIWEYFAYYPLYWLDLTGHPEGTPKAQSHLGIDGLRCDFAQGLPNTFWEYCINKTRQRKWDFLFMAESLDGFRNVAGGSRHGVGYRSARHFDILNENMVFFWRDRFFNYNVGGGGGAGGGATPETFPIWQAIDQRRNAFDNVPLLLNLTSHDEVFPTDDPYRLFYAQAIVSALDGVPMVFYGQEAGARNDRNTYPNGVFNDLNNFTRYESNFGKSIPNFKRFNDMTKIWANRDWNLQGLYGRLGKARARSAALRSPNHYFLSRTDSGFFDPGIFAVAKFLEAGASAAEQDVVFVFVNNDHVANGNRTATFALNAVAPNGQNHFGIQPAHSYNIRDLIGADPNAWVWGGDVLGSDLIAHGIGVVLNGSATAGEQAQYLKLVDRTLGEAPDRDGDGLPDAYDLDNDNDGLPDAWELAHGLDPLDATGDHGAGGDLDGDGMDNLAELIAGTHPNDDQSFLRIDSLGEAVGGREITWDTVAERNYRLQKAPAPGGAWETLLHFTAPGGPWGAVDPAADARAVFRVIVNE